MMARHILVSLMADPGADPQNQMAQPTPLKEKIKADIEKEKEKKIIDDIVARHPIEIEDFEIKVPICQPGRKEPLRECRNERGANAAIAKQMKEAQEKGGKNAPKPAAKDGK